jgi:spermidine/putrescine ABC transporter ATP-binding subunit
LTQSRSVGGSALDIEGIHKQFGGLEVVKGVSIGISPGTILSLLGPSGCGKTTVLRIIAGLLQPTSGQVRLDGEDVTHVAPYRRRIGMVFQNYALFPHMTVAQNVGFGLKMRNISRGNSQPMVQDALDMVRMGAMSDRYPAQLSGGQQQRVSLARAIVTRPRILLLDEPFGALDRKLREEMQFEVKQLQRELGLTFVFVTHDQDEALTMSDTIAVMRAGVIEQSGSPSQVYERPETYFVAEFFGALNAVEVRVVEAEGTVARVEAGCGTWRVPARHRAGGTALFAVRASDTHVSLSPPEAPDIVTLAGDIEDVIYRGTTVLCRVRLADGSKFNANAEPDLAGQLTPGRTIVVNWPCRKSFLFPDRASETSGPPLKEVEL